MIFSRHSHSVLLLEFFPGGISSCGFLTRLAATGSSPLAVRHIVTDSSFTRPSSRVDECLIYTSGVTEDRVQIVWTMILKDDLSVAALTWRVGNYLLLSMSLVAVQIKADIDYTKDKHYTWKTGEVTGWLC
ncbi:thrombospondin type-1 domain-containing protein 7B-like [Arapaima gigas]